MTRRAARQGGTADMVLLCEPHYVVTASHDYATEAICSTHQLAEALRVTDALARLVPTLVLRVHVNLTYRMPDGGVETVHGRVLCVNGPHWRVPLEEWRDATEVA